MLEVNRLVLETSSRALTAPWKLTVRSSDGSSFEAGTQVSGSRIVAGDHRNRNKGSQLIRGTVHGHRRRVRC